MADADVLISQGSGTKIDTRTVGAGTDEHRQVMVIGDPSTAANVASVNGNGALLVQGPQSTATTLSVTTSSSSTGTINVANYNVATVTITGTYAGINLTFEGSTDGGTTWVPMDGAQLDAAASTTGGATGVITSNASRGWDIALGAVDAFRVRSTAYTSGTGAVRIILQTMPYEPLPTVRIAAGATSIGTVDTELPAAAAITDTLANPTTPQIASDQMTFNGSTWERQRSATFTANVDTSSARTATGNGTAAINYAGHKNLTVWINVTAVSGTTPTCVFKLQWSPDNGTTWIDWDTTNLQTTSITAVTTATLRVGVNATTAANAGKQDFLPRQVRLVWTITGTTPSFTFASWYTFTG